MKRTCIFVLFFFLLEQAHAQIDSIQQRIFLIGDGGELHNGEQVVVDWLQKHVDWNDDRNTAIYLGDNIYPLGLPMEGESGYTQYKAVIDAQINLVRGKKSRAYFVMGNHDWMNGKLDGWQRALNQQDYINGLQLSNVAAQPTGGCPGPVLVELGEKVALVLMDSQWFLYLHEKPGPGSNCSSKTVDEFAVELQNIVASHPNHLLLLVMHHPMYSFGTHGGDYTWKEHLFPFTALNRKLYIPLPILGSIYPITRGVFGNVQDIKHPLYQIMANTIESVIKNHPNPVVAAGHEHNLQLILKDSIPYIVSGSGAKLDRIGQGGRGKLLYSDLNYGFTLLEVRKSGRVEARYYNINNKNLNDPNFTYQLKTIDTVPVVIPKDSIPTLPSTIAIAANTELKSNGLKRFFMGRNYRQEWTTPVTAEVLNLGTEQGGISPERQGGGKQTRSLRVVDTSGKEWLLRSVRKFPEAAIPPDLRSPFSRDVVEDGISASYPYASLSVSPLAKAAGIPGIRRKLVYIPDDPRLGRFRSTFKNMLAIMEEREPLGIKKTYNTDELVLRLAKDNDDHVDQKAVLRARLLDNFIMDFDRHDDQWRWATRDTGRGKIYFPIPRDHDQAFFINEGLLPMFIQKPWLIPELQGLEAKADNIKTFNRPSRNFDRAFLNELDWNDWNRQIDTFLNSMTDETIETAMQQQPEALKNLRLNKIISTLKKRRTHFRNDMLQYYRFISKEVTITGTNQRELFLINKQENGNVEVSIFKIDKEGQRSSRIYHRLLDPQITKELRLFGLQDNDSFSVTGSSTPMKIRLIGGPGKDHFSNNSSGGTVIVHDVAFEENKFSGDEHRFRKHVSNNPQENMYNRLFYKYDFINPGISAGYNVDDGILLGAQLEITNQGFRREPYASHHHLFARRALRTSSYLFQYEGHFTRVFRNTDLLLRTDIRAPINVTNFFGIGNKTVFEKNHNEGIRYYRARYDIADVSVLLRKQLQSWLRVYYGGAFQYFRLDKKENENKYISNTELNGLDSTALFKTHIFAGPHLGIDINSRNNPVLPTRGFVLDASLRPVFGLNGVSNNLTQFDVDMRIFASFKSAARVVYAIRLGAGQNWGNYAFPQAQYLSGVDNLRGYRRDRFAGRSVVYNNLEVRLKIADFNTYLFPGQIGVFVFNDVGRVWSDGERSGVWHVGNGAGIYVSPIKRFVVTFTAARSKEEKFIPYVKFGFQF